MVFASSLLSLISPWDRSRAGRSPRSPARCPRPVRPPPPPRRHSDPTTSHHTTTNTITAEHKHRPHSHIETPQSKLDLRQELLNAEDNIEFNWLGDRFEEEIQESWPPHNVLQRSVSLDRGVDIANYLQTIDSDWTGSIVDSMWTVNSDGCESEQYRSLEDIPASQSRVKSRRASSDFDSAFERSLALSVLRNSYKGIDMGSGSLSPQLKKLKWNFSFTKSFEEFKDSKDEIERRLLGALKRPLYKSVSTEFNKKGSSVIKYDKRGKLKKPQFQRMRRDVSVNKSLDGLANAKGNKDFDTNKSFLEDISSGIEEQTITFKNAQELDYFASKREKSVEKRQMFSRSMSTETAVLSEDRKESSVLQSSIFDVLTNQMSTKKSDMSLRKEVLIKQNLSNFYSIEHVKAVSPRNIRRGSIEVYGGAGLNHDSTKRNNNKSTLSVSTSALADGDHLPMASVAKSENCNPSYTSNSLDISRNCGCRICLEAESEVRKSLIHTILSKLFTKIVSCREYGRKLTYWDENNNINEHEMFTCIMHVLKLMLGLWLRHLDHN